METMWGPWEGRSQKAWRNRVGPDHQLPPAAPVVVSLLGQAPWRLARRRRRPRLGPVRRKRRRRRGAQLHDSPFMRHQPSSGTVTRHSPWVLHALPWALQATLYNCDCWHALPRSVITTLTLAPLLVAAPSGTGGTPADVTDGGDETYMLCASNRLSAR
jgi:hypothetical protein